MTSYQKGIILRSNLFSGTLPSQLGLMSNMIGDPSSSSRGFSFEQNSIGGGKVTPISGCLSVYLSIYLSICLSIYLSISLSIYLSVYTQAL